MLRNPILAVAFVLLLAAPLAAQDKECKGSDQPIEGGFDGKYVSVVSPTMQYHWEFRKDGSYSYTAIAGSAATGERTEVRGIYEVEGKYLVLHPCRETKPGGAAEKASGTERLRFEILKDGIVLAGDRYKLKT